MTDDQQRLEAFVDEPSRRPLVHKNEQVGPIRVESKGYIHPGYVGPVPAREKYGFVGFRERAKHFHRNEEAYMMSDKVLEILRSKGVQLIFIAEDDTGDVYEFHESQFNERVPQRAKGSREKDEDQTLVRVNEHRGRYDNHAAHVLVGNREDN